jgi:hypothetical protein
MLERYFAFGLKIVGQILPIAQIALLFIPGGQIPAAGLKILEKLPDIIGLAERIFGDGSGAEKKAFAIQTAQALANTIGGVSTGGQAETWQKIEVAVGPMIDQIVKVVNSYQEFSIAEQAATVNASATP